MKFQSKLEKQEISAPVFEIKSIPGSNRILPEVVQSGSINEKLWVGQSLNTTLSRLLASGQSERQADQLRREFRVSEKRFAFLRVVGMAINNASWLEMDKMIRAKKPPVNVEVPNKSLNNCFLMMMLCCIIIFTILFLSESTQKYPSWEF